MEVLLGGIAAAWQAIEQVLTQVLRDEPMRVLPCFFVEVPNRFTMSAVQTLAGHQRPVFWPDDQAVNRYSLIVRRAEMDGAPFGLVWLHMPL